MLVGSDNLPAGKWQMIRAGNMLLTSSSSVVQRAGGQEVPSGKVRKVTRLGRQAKLTQFKAQVTHSQSTIMHVPHVEAQRASRPVLPRA